MLTLYQDDDIMKTTPFWKIRLVHSVYTLQPLIIYKEQTDEENCK